MSQHRREAFARQRGSRGHSDHGFFLSLWHGSAAVEACWSPCKTLRVAVAMLERFSVLDFFPAADGWCCFLVEILCFPSRQKAALQPERWPAAVCGSRQSPLPYYPAHAHTAVRSRENAFRGLAWFDECVEAGRVFSVERTWLRGRLAALCDHAVLKRPGLAQS